MTIAIIAILASLLLPALSGAKRRAQATYCGNNLNQLQLSMHLYTMDNNEAFPWNSFARGLSDVYPNWVGGWMAYETWVAPSSLSDCTNKAILVSSKYGHIGAYSKSPEIYKCPADKSYVQFSDGKHSRVRSYAMNGYIGAQYAVSGPWFLFSKTSDFNQISPANIFSFVDEHEDSVVDGYFGIADPKYSGFIFGDAAPASHHGRSTPLAFCDGHVEIKRWRDPRTIIPVRRVEWTRVTFDTPNSDCQWLFDHSTRRIE